MNTEANTCRKFVVPRLQAAGWDNAPHAINEQRTFTDGRVIFVGGRARRGRQKRPDYILRFSADYPIAVVEAKASYKYAADGLQQAKDYAEILGLKFAIATNGAEIVEFDFFTGVETLRTDFPAPAELLGAPARGPGLSRRCCGQSAPHARVSRPRQAAALLSRRRGQSGAPSHSHRQAPGALDAMYRRRKDGGGFPDCLAALEFWME